MRVQCVRPSAMRRRSLFRPGRRPGQAARIVTAIAVAAALVAGFIAASAGLLPRVPIAAARADEVTASQDDLRTGWDPSEPGLTPATVGGPSFGLIFKTHLDGQIYGQPLIAGSTLIVTTETNHVYGLDAATGDLKWSDYLGPAEPASSTACGDLTPDIGITSTPVYDPATGTVYLVAVVNDGPTEFQPHIYADALDAQTGATRSGWPVAIQGSPVNDPTAIFNPFTERQRAGLLLMNGWVYVAFASYCDFQPYVGYVAGVNASSGALTLWSDEAGLTDSQGGIWQSNGGLMSDGPGRIFLATGNGVSPAPGPGTSPPPELGDAVVRLNVAANGMLSAGDFFSPANAPTLDAHDRDFGSGGPVGLPFGTASYPDLLVQAGKDGRVFMLSRDNLGGRDQGSGGTDDDVSMTGPYGGQFGHPAAFGPDATVSAATSSDFVYYIGVGDVMRYLQFGVNSAGTPVLADVANSTTSFAYTSGSPVVTSNGGDPASAVVWNVDAPGEAGTGATLEAFDAVPSGTCTSAAPCSMSPIWSAPIGTASKFSTPATNDGRVYVGTRDGNVFCFGSPDLAPLAGSPVNVGAAAVGGPSRTGTVTMTASSAVTVTGISLAAPPGADPFTLGAAQVNGSPALFPASLNPGDKLTVPVTFAPARPGGTTVAVQVATTAANFPTITVSLTGQGSAPGLQASAATAAFGGVPDGTAVSTSVMLTNDSTATEKVIASRAPGAPFSAGLPASGRVLKAGQSLAVVVSYRPRRLGNSASAFSITTSGRRVLTVRLTGTGLRAVSRLTVAPAAVQFGSVELGSRASRVMVITNTGNLPAVIGQTHNPEEPFGMQQTPPSGLPVNPGYSVRVPVTFTPTSTGDVTGIYRLRWRDELGSHLLTVRLAGTGIPVSTGTAVPPPGGGWTLNGSAAMSGEHLALSTAVRNGAGSAVYAVPEPTSQLTMRFSARLSGDGGMTIALLRASAASTQSLGGNGGQLGFGGLPGVAVTLATRRFAGDPSSDSVGIAESSAGGLHYLATAPFPDLGRGSHRVTVTVSSRRMRVSIDGRQVLSVLLSSAALPRDSLVAFTGSTGSSPGSQAVSGVTISVGGSALPAPGGGWSFNGSAAQSGSAAVLTKAVKNEAGSVVYPVALPTSGLRVTFTAQLTGGTGGNGLAFALLNPSKAKPTSVGADSGLGFLPLGGVAVALDTRSAFSAPYWAALWANTVGSSTPNRLALARAIPPLRSGPQTVSVQVSQQGASYLVSVWLDGELILQQAAPSLTATSVLAFTAGTSGRTDMHLVRDVAITAAS